MGEGSAQQIYVQIWKDDCEWTPRSTLSPGQRDTAPYLGPSLHHEYRLAASNHGSESSEREITVECQNSEL